LEPRFGKILGGIDIEEGIDGDATEQNRRERCDNPVVFLHPSQATMRRMPAMPVSIAPASETGQTPKVGWAPAAEAAMATAERSPPAASRNAETRSRGKNGVSQAAVTTKRAEGTLSRAHSMRKNACQRAGKTWDRVFCHGQA
jgi:hypothetical protein